MKKHNYFAKPVLFTFTLILIPVLIVNWKKIWGRMYLRMRPDLRHVLGLHGTAILLLIIFYILIMWIFIEIALWRGASRKEGSWYWKHKKNKIVSAKLLSIGSNNKPQLNDLDYLKNKEQTAKFSINFGEKIGWKDVWIESTDPDLDSVIEVIENKNFLLDKHITKTKIIAVNNETVTYTNGGVSVGGALIGGMLAGDVGALLGGLSGTKTSQTSSGENTYTFVVFYDDKAPETEQVRESSKRFKFLISKLDMA